MLYGGLLRPEPLLQATTDLYLYRTHSQIVLAHSLWVGHAFCVLPKSERIRWPCAWRVHCPRCAVCLLLSFLGALREHHLRCAVSPPESWSQAATLLADINHPGSQEDVVSSWEPAHSLVEDAISGAEIVAAPCLLALAIPSLPLCLWAWTSQYAAG